MMSRNLQEIPMPIECILQKFPFDQPLDWDDHRPNKVQAQSKAFDDIAHRAFSDLAFTNPKLVI